MVYIDYLYATILGIVQGITEFLPISSSGHLLLLHEAFQFDTANALAFDIALHTGTLVSILIFFYKDIIGYFQHQRDLLLKALISCLPAGIIGALFGDTIEQVFRSSWVVVVMLVLVSIVFIMVERYAKPTNDLNQITWPQVVAMGLAQAISLIPGTSRSGITLAAGMGYGLKRVDAAKFSFIMVIPLLLALTAKEGLDLASQTFNGQQLSLMAVGAITSAAVGLLSIRFLMDFFRRYSLLPFAYYRIALAVVVSLVLFL